LSETCEKYKAVLSKVFKLVLDIEDEYLALRDIDAIKYDNGTIRHVLINNINTIKETIRRVLLD